MSAIADIQVITRQNVNTLVYAKMWKQEKKPEYHPKIAQSTHSKNVQESQSNDMSAEWKNAQTHN